MQIRAERESLDFPMLLRMRVRVLEDLELPVPYLSNSGLRPGARHTFTGPCLASSNAAVARRTRAQAALELLVPGMTYVVLIWHKMVTQNPVGAKGPQKSSRQDAVSP